MIEIGSEAATTSPDHRVAAVVATALPDAALVLDAGARVVWANPAAERLFGIRLEDCVGVSGLDFVHPDDLSVAMLSVDSMAGKEAGSLLELRMRHADGSWRLMELRGASLDGGLLLCIRDLTDRRRWEVVGDETAAVRAVLQNAETLVVLMDAEGVVQRSSIALTRLLGWGQDWLEGRSIAALVDPGDHDELEVALRQVVATEGGSVTLDVRLIDDDGDRRHYALTFSNTLDDPVVGGIVATGHDVSDRVRGEDELRRANSVLVATLESTTDGILVVDTTGRITSFNHRFVEMWGLSHDVMATGDDGMMLASVLVQLRDPVGFISKVLDLYGAPDASSRDTIEFTDGRVFERESLPQLIDGEVVGRVWSFRDRTEEVRLEEELAHQAFHDSLTGLANQALFRDRLGMSATRLARSGGRLAVLFIDLDGFKTVNDSLGHSAGDQMLTVVSERITSCLRASDTAARLGGDEFAVLIDDLSSPEDASGVAHRILGALRAPISLDSTQVVPAASIGIAYGEAGMAVDDLLRNADLAMYTAKSAGKNCVRVFADEMHLAAVERLDLESRLRGAADRGELVVHYQPIVELPTGRVVSMEALVRWVHPERGLLSPAAFVSFAEESGLIHEIGHHVLVTAAARAATWQGLVGSEASPSISVNLSPRQLLAPTIVDEVAECVRSRGLAPRRLLLEITESALMADPRVAAERLAQLRDLGVRLAVDDFGTGYSSLSYLRDFPVDVLKIDGSFIDDQLSAPGSLTRVILQIADALGLDAVAEGIETEEQARELQALGCVLGQGYHLGRPMEAEAADRMVLERNGDRRPAV